LQSSTTTTENFAGTSAAAPQVAGAAALMLSARPELRDDEVKHILQTTANKIPVTNPVYGYDPWGRSLKFGHGLLDVFRAVHHAFGPWVLAAQANALSILSSNFWIDVVEPLPALFLEKILEKVKLPIVLPQKDRIPARLEIVVHNRSSRGTQPMTIRVRSGGRTLEATGRTQAIGGGQAVRIRRTFDLHAFAVDGAVQRDMTVELVDKQTGEVVARCTPQLAFGIGGRDPDEG
jgi:hypothetical protein